MKFSVVDKTTGEPADIDELALEMSKSRIYCHINYRKAEMFALSADGHLILCDNSRRWEYVDAERENLKIVFEEETDAAE